MSNLRNITFITSDSTSISHVIINRARKNIRVTWKLNANAEYVYQVTSEQIAELLSVIENKESVGSWVYENLKRTNHPFTKIPATVQFATA